jgi:AraC-like DNA-binding protein
MAAQRGNDLQSGLALGTGDASSQLSERPQQHVDVELNYVVSGEIRRSFCGHELTIPPERLTVFWAGFAHQVIRAVNPTPYFWVHISLEVLLGWHLPMAFKQAILAGQVFMESTGDRRSLDLGLFQCWACEADRMMSIGSRWTLLEIEARLGRLAEATRMTVPRDSGQQGVLSQTQAAASARIALFLNQHYSEPVYWKEVAQVAGLSVPSARKCFLRSYGMTLHQYLLQLRLAQAKEMIAHANAKIIDIALETGFPTLSNFYRTFEAVVGQTPSAYRRSLAQPYRSGSRRTRIR